MGPTNQESKRVNWIDPHRRRKHAQLHPPFLEHTHVIFAQTLRVGEWNDKIIFLFLSLAGSMVNVEDGWSNVAEERENERLRYIQVGKDTTLAVIVVQLIIVGARDLDNDILISSLPTPALAPISLSHSSLIPSYLPYYLPSFRYFSFPFISHGRIATGTAFRSTHTPSVRTSM